MRRRVPIGRRAVRAVKRVLLIVAAGTLAGAAPASASAPAAGGAVKYIATLVKEPHSIAALDAAGRLLGFGGGPGYGVGEVSVCPGGEVTAEQAHFADGKGGVYIRTLDDLRTTKAIRVPRDVSIYGLRCLEHDGSRVAGVLNAGHVNSERKQIVIFEDERRRTLRKVVDPTHATPVLGGSAAYFGRSVLNLRTGRVRRFGKLPVDAAPMALSPDRKLLAYSVGEAEMLIADTETGAIVKRSPYVGHVLWVDDDRIFTSRKQRGNDPLWKVFTTDSKQIRSFRMQDAPAFVDHGELVSTVGGRILRRDHDGRIVDRGPEVPGRGFIAAVVP